MKHLLTSFLLLSSLALFAQPAYDDCSGVFGLGAAPWCDETVLFNNVGATESNIGFDNFPPCFIGNPTRDVWFSFVAVDTILDYRVILTGCPDQTVPTTTIQNPQIAVYRGDCEFDGLQLLDCVSADNGETIVEIDLFGLTPGITYFLRINDWSPSASPNDGGFKLCVIKKPPVTTIDGGGSTACSGTLADSGGEDGDYLNDENYVFSICPTTPSNCINFTLQYFEIENFSDVLTFFDGPTTSSPFIASLSGGGSFEVNGGVCYSVSASSGCLTVQFTSDNTSSFSGFLGSWECTADECNPEELIGVDTDATPEEIVQSVISGNSLITITDINCPNGAMGVFSNGIDAELGLETGMLLTSGSAQQVSSPAFNTAATNHFTLGDADLDVLSVLYSNGSLSMDACIVEMDVFAATDEITFEYVFGSEEYPEWVNNIFTDIFAFLVSGPGIVGDPAINNQKNVATLPDGTFIEINTLNGGLNWQYYRNNENSQSIVYDGLTSDSMGVKKSLTAKINTIPCNTYHLKFAVADRSDTTLDSGVFISEIKGGSPVIAVNYQSGIEYLVEECTVVPDELVIGVNTVITDSIVFDVVVEGTATPDLDYILYIPSSITLTPDAPTFTLPIIPLPDGIPEGIETIVIKLTRDFGCGVVVLAELVVEIHDNLLVQIFEDELDTLLVCGGSTPQVEVVGAADYFWQPPGIFSDPNISNPTVTVDSSQWISVTGTLGVCTDVDSIYLQLITPEVSILPGNFINLCQGDTVVLFAQNNVNDANLLWQTFFVNLPDPTNPEQVIIPPPFFNFMFFSVSVELGGCIATDDVQISIDAFDFPQLANDTTICQNYSVDLGSDVQFTATTFNWTPDEFLEPGGFVSGPIATPEVTTTYTLVATSPTGACVDTASVTITVVPADVDFENPDTTFICIGDSVTLNINSTTNGVGVTWQPQTFFTQVTPEQAIVYPPVTTWYYSVLEAPGCSVVDSVLVYVDSLPELSLMTIPDKETFCEGEEVTIYSTTYEPANFPGIEFFWEGTLPGAQTPDSFLNLVFIAQEDFTWTRTTTIHACTSVDSLFIGVTPVASMSIDPATSTICPGDPVSLVVTADPGITDLEWTPPTGLSCTDCTNPTATPSTSTTYSVEGEFEGCPVGASATINVLPPAGLAFPDPPFVCAGDDILLNEINDPNATYVWTSSDNSLNTTEGQPVVSPTQTTTYTVTASNGICSTTSEVTVTVPADFSVSVSPNAIVCSDAATALTATATQPNVIFVWEDENGNPAGNGATINVTPTMGTTYTVTASDPAGCYSHDASVTLDVHPGFTFSAEADTTVNVMEPVTLTADATLAGVTFSWTDASGALVGSGPSVTVSTCATTVYTVTAIDAAGCYGQMQNLTVTVIQPNLQLQTTPAVDTTVSAGQEVTLMATSVIPGTTFEWFDNFGVSIGTTANVTVSSCETTPYKVVATDPTGCYNKESTVMVNVEAGFSIQKVTVTKVEMDSLTLYEGQEVILSVTTTPEVLPGATYNWFLNGELIATTTDTLTDPIRLPEIVEENPDSVSYNFSVQITSAEGCDDDKATDVFINNVPVDLPNVFSPNGDGMNDNFTLVSRIPVEIIDFKVWNRWGQIVYENKNGLTGWDGNQKDEPAPSDVFVYFVKYQIVGGTKQYTLKGDVTLVR